MTNDSQMQQGGDEEHTSEGSTDMATLLEESSEYRSPQRGEILEGTVMGWDRDGALIDIGAKSEGLILRHEMQSLGSDAESKLQSGEKVLVFVVHPETADGQIVLSLDKARGEHGWHTLQERFESGESFEAEVTGFNKGGLLVNVEGVNAFVPLSQVVGVRPDRNREDGESGLSDVVGRSLRLKVIEVNRRRNRVILSERAALQEWRMEQKERLIQELHEGDIRRGRVSSVRNFGVFVDLGGADGLAHLSELSWERDKTPSELFKVGDEVEVYVTKIDAENKKIALSLRRANPEQWEVVVDKYQEGQIVTGLVTKLVAFGAFARIEGPVEGLIHVSELVDRRIGHPKEVVREGDLLPLKVVRIERDRHRLGLSLRRARDEGEGLGYVFSEGGEVISVPEDIRAEFIEREGPIPTPTPLEDDDHESSLGQSQASVATEEPAAAEADASAEAAVSEEPAVEADAPGEPEASVATEEPPATDAEASAEATASEEPEAEAEAPSEPEASVATEEPPAAEEPASEEPEADAEAPSEPEASVATEEPPAAEEPASEEPDAEAPSEPEASVATDEPPAAEEPASEEPAAEATEAEESKATTDSNDEEADSGADEEDETASS